MRLAQLARKLAVRPADITAFLKANNIDVEKGSNFRLDDQTVALVLKEFGETSDPINTTQPDSEPDSDPTDIHDRLSPQDIAVQAAEVPETVGPGESIEVIKAPKVELPGLRVLGKIDLPEPKPKIPEEDGDAAVDATNPAPERPSVRRKKNRTDTSAGPRKNPVTLQREREARKAEKKRRAEIEIEKERRRQKYLSKVKINVPTKPAKIYEEGIEELPQEIAANPKAGLWGKFLRWLRREP